MTRDAAFHAPRSRRSGAERDDASRPSARGDAATRERLSRQGRATRRPGTPPREPGDAPAAGVSAKEAVERLPRRRPAHYREAALFYDPPYESPLADRLAQRLVQSLRPSCGLQHEAVALTPYNCFRLDFLIETGGGPIRSGSGRPGQAPERAGLLLGERPEAEGAPALYDALVVGSGAVDVLYRFDRAGLDAHLDDALFLMSEHAPTLFERPERLQAAASERPCSGTLCGPDVRFSYPTPPVEAEEGGALAERSPKQPDLVMRRLRADEPAAWADDYRRALTHFRIPESQHRPPEALRRRAA